MYFNYEMNRISILVHISSPFRGITLAKKRSRAQSENKHRPDRRRIIADSKDKFRGAVYVFTGPYVENLERGSLCVHHLSMVVGIQRSGTRRSNRQRERERKREPHPGEATSFSSFTIARREAREKRWEPRRTVVAEAFSGQSRLSLRVRRIPDDERTWILAPWVSMCTFFSPYHVRCTTSFRLSTSRFFQDLSWIRTIVTLVPFKIMYVVCACVCALCERGKWCVCAYTKVKRDQGTIRIEAGDLVDRERFRFCSWTKW